MNLNWMKEKNIVEVIPKNSLTTDRENYKLSERLLFIWLMSTWYFYEPNFIVLSAILGHFCLQYHNP